MSTRKMSMLLESMRTINENKFDDEYEMTLGNEFDDDYESTLGDGPHGNKSLDGVIDDDEWMMKGGEDGLGIDGDNRHDRMGDEYGDDPWGLGMDEGINDMGGAAQEDYTDIEIEGIDFDDYGDYSDAYVGAAKWAFNGQPLNDDELDDLNSEHPDWLGDIIQSQATDNMADMGDNYRDMERDGMFEDEPDSVPDDIQMKESPTPRQYTERLLSAAEDGEIDYESLATAALMWMSESSVASMFEQEFDWLDGEEEEY